MMNVIRLFLCTTSTLAAVLSSSAQAADANLPSQEAVEDIVVTATKTGESQSQKTPLAITVLSADRLNASLVTNVKDLLFIAPNLNVAASTVNAQIYIRGVGSNNVFAGSDPDVTVQVDGVPLSRPFAQFSDYNDVQRIEVLRGPQGTLYGRNAVGGTINIISRIPSNSFHAQLVGTLGNFGLAQGQVYLTGPLVKDVLQGSLTGNYVRHGSYYDNIVPGKHDVGSTERGGIRGQLRWEPTATFDMALRADYSRSHDHPDNFSHIFAPYAFAPLANSTIGDRDRVALDADQTSRTRLWGVSAELNYRFSSVVALKSLTAYRYSYFNVVNDTDATEYFQNLGLQRSRNRAFTQEFNLTARRDRWNGVIGAFAADENEKTYLASIVPPGPAVPAAASAMAVAQPVSKLTSAAVFAQGTLNLTDTLRLTAGIRYTRDRKTLDANFQRTSLNPATLGVSSPGFPFIAHVSRRFSATTPKVGIDWQVTPTFLAYASVTKGYKSGGTNATATRLAAAAFAPETLISYEGGIKSEWFDRRLRFNATGFRYDYKDLQVQSLIAAGVSAIGNAATATITGAEFELSAKPTSNLELTANYSLLDATYGRFPSASVPVALRPYLATDPHYNATLATYDASGKRLNAAPKSSFSATAQWEHDLGVGTVFLRGEYAWQARVDYDPSNADILSQRAFSLVNLSAGYKDPVGKWAAQIVAKNVGDTRYYITKAAISVVPAGLAGAPRTIAVQLTKNW